MDIIESYPAENQQDRPGRVYLRAILSDQLRGCFFYLEPGLALLFGMSQSLAIRSLFFTPL